MKKGINFKKWKLIGSIFGIIAGVQFIIMTVLMMLLYPGGYSFWDNKISYLGYYTSANNGNPNFLCQTLFVITFISFTVLLIPFFLVLVLILKIRKL